MPVGRWFGAGVAAGLLVTTAPAAAAECPPLVGRGAAEARPNDNGAAAGTLRGDTVTLRLVARAATWYPDGPGGCALHVNAFAEEGKPPTIPGPLLHVRPGTEVMVTMRNALPRPIWLRGLQDRDTGTLDSIAIPPDSVRTFRFRATAPGAWYYWAGAATTARFPLSNEDGQLVGALVVDDVRQSDGMASVRRVKERIVVMTRWTPEGTTGLEGFQLNAMNGRSWPATERLEYTVGDSLHWHVINASDELHMMHLHGFYFRIDSRGDAAHDSLLTRDRPPTRVTVAVRRGEWMSMTWSPDRPGNWLFHCHLIAHMSEAQRLTNYSPGVAAKSRQQHASMGNHATDAMGGLIMGITVRPARTASAAGEPATQPSARGRSLQLFVDRRERVFGESPGFGFVLQQDERVPAADSILIPGSPLVLAKGEPVAITVHNRLPAPVAIHWHGIELESYYDGVAGWSGNGTRIAPSIAPGRTFVARFTPPRAGTFMYHIHSERGDELASGLYAPLIVLEPGTSFDNRHDRVFVIAGAGPSAEHAVAVNGSVTPDTVQLVVGDTYRLRLIDISANDVHLTTLRGPDGLVPWRLVAGDGWNVSDAERMPRPARTVTSAGITQDYEFTPSAPGDYALVVAQAVTAGATPTGKVTTVPLRVRAP